MNDPSQFLLEGLVTGGQNGTTFAGFAVGIDLGRADTQASIRSVITPRAKPRRVILLAVCSLVACRGLPFRSRMGGGGIAASGAAMDGGSKAGRQ